MLSSHLAEVLAGMVLVGAGTFFAQASATGFVGQAASESRGVASGTYLACYFLGGLVGSAVLGQLFDRFGWIACVAGVLLPFLLHRSPRVSAAVEPYIMASMGIPKYALAPWLILWFGIGDLPKLVVVTLMVFYIIFITTSAGIRAVDQRLIDMARIAGAGETAIAREIIWKSLLPFFFTGLKVALPRAVSATIVGEFLVATQGVGHYIEHSRQVADTVGVFAGIVIAMVLVLSINAVVNVVERRALGWRPVERDMEL